MIIERCTRCGRERPDYIADPTCPEGGYCNWQRERRPAGRRINESGDDRSYTGFVGLDDQRTQLARLEVCRDCEAELAVLLRGAAAVHGIIRLDRILPFLAPKAAEAEVERLTKERDELWALLDNIDTLDDACREYDGKFRVLARKHLKKRFEIHNPEATEKTEKADGSPKT